MPRRLEISENEYYILNALAREPLYGYGIRKEVEKITDGKKKLSLATLYDALYKLRQEHLIESAGYQQVDGRTRHSYKITGTGEHALKERYRTILLLQNISQLRGAEGEV